MILPALFSGAFGGLHLVKAVINAFRCYCLTFNGHNFGLYKLRAFRLNSEEAAASLLKIKNAVFEANDRQSDYLVYMTFYKLVIDALIAKETYCITRIPERILSYKENDRSQLRIVEPLAIQTNTNCDIFLLDQGASCLHIYDRSDAVKDYIVGEYSKPQIGPYKKGATKDLTAKKSKFGNALTSLDVHDENVYVADQSRGEIIIIRNCRLASRVSSKRAFLLKFEDCLQLVKCVSMLIVLCTMDEDVQLKGVDIYNTFR